MADEKPKKLNLRKKAKTGVKTKIEKKKAQIMKANSRRTLTLESEEVQHLLIGRPKVFKNSEELIKLFNTYILTCLEKKRYYEIVPVKTVDTKAGDTTHTVLEAVDNEELTVEEEITEAKASKKEAGRQDITNKLESKYEIKERIERKTTPSI